MKEFKDFQHDLGKRESTNNYRCVNSLGYLGRYQFGKARLWDLGYSIDRWRPKSVKAIPNNMKVISKETFLNDLNLQDTLFLKHVRDYVRQISRSYPADIIEKYSLSGMIAAAHLLGLGGLEKYVNARKLQESDNPESIRKGKKIEATLKDGYGTKISEYIGFKDYQIV